MLHAQCWQWGLWGTPAACRLRAGRPAGHPRPPQRAPTGVAHYRLLAAASRHVTHLVGGVAAGGVLGVVAGIVGGGQGLQAGERGRGLGAVTRLSGRGGTAGSTPPPCSPPRATLSKVLHAFTELLGSTLGPRGALAASRLIALGPAAGTAALPHAGWCASRALLQASERLGDSPSPAAGLRRRRRRPSAWWSGVWKC